MTARDAISLLLTRFPILKERVGDPEDLSTSPHIVYSLLAAEILENSSDEALLHAASRFINDLANSGDSLLEELLVIDILEGIAQSPELANWFMKRINPNAGELLRNVEREYFGRDPQQQA